MANKLQRRHLGEIGAKTTEKSEAKYGVFVKFQNQNGVVFLFSLNMQRSVHLSSELGINKIELLFHI